MADSTKSVEYQINGDPAGFVAAMQKTAEASRSASEAIQKQFSSIGDAFGAVQKQLMAVAALVAGGAFFKEAIDASNKLTGETMNLSKRLGITAEQASVLRTALGQIGSDSDTYVGAFDKFAKQLKKNEKGLQDMGLQTRDANGDLRDSNTLFTEALQTVGQYKPGLDQTTAAMTLFGKSVDEVMALQKLNTEVMEKARQKNAELGLTVTKENVEASKKYKVAMADVGNVLTAVKKVIGDAVMPVFTEMAEYLAETGPYVIGVFKGALTALLLVFRAVQMGVKVLVAVIAESVNHLMDQLGNLSDLLAAVFRGDFAGAAKIWEDMGKRYGQAIHNVVDATKEAFTDAQQSFAGDMQRMWGGGTAVGKPKGGTKTMGDFKEPQDKSRMSEWEARLDEEKLAIAERARAEGTFREMSKAEEVAYWEAIKSTTTLSAAELLAVRKKVATGGMEMRKAEFQADLEALLVERQEAQHNYDERIRLASAAYSKVAAAYGAESKEAKKAFGDILAEQRAYSAQLLRLQQMEAEQRRAGQASAIELERIEMQERAQFGIITKEQELQAEVRFEERLYQIKLAALRERLALIDKDRDPLAYAQANAQLEQAAAAHNQRMAGLTSQVNVEHFRPMLNAFQTLEDGMVSVGQTMLTNWRSVGQAMQQVVTQIGQSIITETVIKPLAAKAAGFLKERAMQLMGIETDAVKAGTGAAASQASIPFIGPILAVAAMIAIMAQVRGQKASVPSAAGGYDIPASVNPLVQLHEKEMVLPAKHADVIRGLSAGADSARRGAAMGVEIKAHPMPGNYFMVHRDQLVEAIESARRHFAMR